MENVLNIYIYVTPVRVLGSFLVKNVELLSSSTNGKRR